MCGRYTQHQTTDQVVIRFEVDTVLKEVSERYNIAPTQSVPVILIPDDSDKRILDAFQWGLVPAWAKDASIANKLLNARSETAAEKPSFRSAIKRRRCLIPADGYYEWRTEGKAKQPIYYRLREGAPFAFAGLWEVWKQPDGSPLMSCTILTTQPNELAAEAHDRMPVILLPQHEARWLSHEQLSNDELALLSTPYPAASMEGYPVSTRVNRAIGNDADMIRPLEPVRPTEATSRTLFDL